MDSVPTQSRLPSSCYPQGMPRLSPRAACLLATISLGVSGCHSAFVETTVQNRSGLPISLLELDYPSASFGTQNLAAGADFHYRFKVLGSGPVKLTYTDSTGHEHASSGPTLQEGTEGLLTVTVSPGVVRWQTTFRQKH